VSETVIDINNISELEHAFAEDFGTPVFPVLANHYLKNNDMKRSRKVCELGLKYSPYNSDGKFILAKLNLYENKLMTGEQLLKQVVDENPIHINGLRILIEVMRSLNRSSNTIKKYVHRILNILPDDEDALALLEVFEKSFISKNVNLVVPDINTGATAGHETETLKKETKAKLVASPPEARLFDVGVSMATFTMVGVLKSQKNYRQALAVLSRLEEKGADVKRITQERAELEGLLATE
jgi:tetratricopeptide (TPR) repeat protein